MLTDKPWPCVIFRKRGVPAGFLESKTSRFHVPVFIMGRHMLRWRKDSELEEYVPSTNYCSDIKDGNDEDGEDEQEEDDDDEDTEEIRRLKQVRRQAFEEAAMWHPLVYFEDLVAAKMADHDLKRRHESEAEGESEDPATPARGPKPAYRTPPTSGFRKKMPLDRVRPSTPYFHSSSSKKIPKKTFPRKSPEVTPSKASSKGKGKQTTGNTANTASLRRRAGFSDVSHGATSFTSTLRAPERKIGEKSKLTPDEDDDVFNVTDDDEESAQIANDTHEHRRKRRRSRKFQEFTFPSPPENTFSGPNTTANPVFRQRGFKGSHDGPGKAYICVSDGPSEQYVETSKAILAKHIDTFAQDFVPGQVDVCSGLKSVLRSAVLAKIPALEFLPVAEFLANGDYRPLLARDSLRASLDSVLSARQHEDHVLLAGSLWKHARSLRLIGLMSLIVEKIEAQWPLAPEALLKFVRTIFSDKASGWGVESHLRAMLVQEVVKRILPLIVKQGKLVVKVIREMPEVTAVLGSRLLEGVEGMDVEEGSEDEEEDLEADEIYGTGNMYLEMDHEPSDVEMNKEEDDSELDEDLEEEGFETDEDLVDDQDYAQDNDQDDDQDSDEDSDQDEDDQEVIGGFVDVGEDDQDEDMKDDGKAVGEDNGDRDEPVIANNEATQHEKINGDDLNATDKDKPDQLESDENEAGQDEEINNDDNLNEATDQHVTKADQHVTETKQIEKEAEAQHEACRDEEMNDYYLTEATDDSETTYQDIIQADQFDNEAELQIQEKVEDQTGEEAEDQDEEEAEDQDEGSGTEGSDTEDEDDSEVGDD